MDPAERIGRLLPTLLFGGLVCYFLLRAVRARAPSARLANLTLVCGLLAFCMPEFALGVKRVPVAGTPLPVDPAFGELAAVPDATQERP